MLISQVSLTLGEFEVQKLKQVVGKRGRAITKEFREFMQLKAEDESKLLNMLADVTLAQRSVIFSTDEDACRCRLQFLKLEREGLSRRLTASKRREHGCVVRHARAREQLDAEVEHLKALSQVMSDAQIVRIALHGATGHGKSTLGNRIFGDVTDDSGKGPFQVSHSCTGMTQSIETRVISGVYADPKDGSPMTISVTDGLGADGYHRINNARALAEHLHGVDFINAIVFVKTAIPVRWDEVSRLMFKELIECFGAEVWNHVIIVLTHFCARGHYRYYGKGMSRFREYLRTVLMGLDVDMGEFDLGKLPIIPMELMAEREDYEPKIKALVERVLPRMGKLRSPLLLPRSKQLRNAVDSEYLRLQKAKLEVEKLARYDALCENQCNELRAKCGYA
jgi:hypothetical protein